MGVAIPVPLFEQKTIDGHVVVVASYDGIAGSGLTKERAQAQFEQWYRMLRTDGQWT
jgi:hypothetical protein